MTPQKIHRLPDEEQPSDSSQESTEFDSSTDEALTNEPLAADSVPEGDELGDQAPSLPDDEPSSSDESEFEFPVGEGEAEFTPFSTRFESDEPIRLSSSRRRRRQNRLVTRPDASELGERLESMARRSAPTFDFFFFSLVAGAILGVGYLFDAPPILLFGILIAPILAPWVGTALAAATGEVRFLGQTLGGFFTALLMIFLTGLLAGLVARIFMPIVTSQALLHARLWPFDLLLVAIGTLVLTIAFVQTEEKPVIASLMLAYEIYLPVSAAGFGLGSGVENLWPQALLVLLVHLAISIVLALVVFYYMGFRPLETFGYALTGLIVVASLAGAFAAFMWGGSVRGNRALATPVYTTATVVVSAASQPTFTAPAPQPTSTYIALVTATPGITPSPTELPTPVYGKIQSKGGDGAMIRTEPSGSPITTIQNGYLVEILPDQPMSLEGTTWVRVRVKTTTRDIVGWVLLNLIVTATPAPAPSLTPISTATP